MKAFYSSARQQHSQNPPLGLIEFFKRVCGENEHKLEELAECYLTEKRNVEEHSSKLRNYNDKPPKTVRLLLNATRNFLIENDIDLSARPGEDLSEELEEAGS